MLIIASIPSLLVFVPSGKMSSPTCTRSCLNRSRGKQTLGQLSLIYWIHVTLPDQGQPLILYFRLFFLSLWKSRSKNLSGNVCDQSDLTEPWSLTHLSLLGKHQQFDSHVLPSDKHEISSPWHQLTNSASRSPREILCLPLRVKSSPHMFFGIFCSQKHLWKFFIQQGAQTDTWWSLPAIIKREEINYYVSPTRAQRNDLKLPITTQLFKNLVTCLQKIPCFSHSCIAIKNWHGFLFMQFNAHTLFITLGIAGH